MKMEVFQRPWLSNGPAKVILSPKIVTQILSPRSCHQYFVGEKLITDNWATHCNLPKPDQIHPHQSLTRTNLPSGKQVLPPHFIPTTTLTLTHRDGKACP